MLDRLLALLRADAGVPEPPEAEFGWCAYPPGSSPGRESSAVPSSGGRPTPGGACSHRPAAGSRAGADGTDPRLLHVRASGRTMGECPSPIAPPG